MDAGYRELLKFATALAHRRRSWFKNASKLDLAEEIVQEALGRAWQ